jgi:hypothetical protein
MRVSFDLSPGERLSLEPHPLPTARRPAQIGFMRSSTTATGLWPGATRPPAPHGQCRRRPRIAQRVMFDSNLSV